MCLVLIFIAAVDGVYLQACSPVNEYNKLNEASEGSIPTSEKSFYRNHPAVICLRFGKQLKHILYK